jgi:hypothetical protein
MKENRILTSSDRYINFAYLYHLHGINGLCVPLISAASCVLSNREESVLNFNNFLKYKPTFYTALPIQHQYLVDDAKTKGVTYKNNLRGIITGSAKTSIAL